ncbi:hypothetical protein MTR67_052618 [Solanum verrucosum]|uniref:CCR4-Not complex component Not N-terminal domain-containing protein n=1 Tax=Solanum verrucosum TaxID=315347 RepID=A0AAF0V9H2_SOLVR|nr:hypothetical protein MTR67_052618 [Solanum verrucosum]
MGASRKLQGEIDRVLKKVQEGVDVFDSIWNKVYDTDNANQKEKFEADLKKEIKKLQRYRDQIKTWIQSSEIKDKKVSASYEQALMDARKLIEREMERFKICEKETKTKAFSKEGLGQQPKTDPKEKAKSETRDWLNNVVGELESQIDNFEAELEGLSVKKGKQRPPRLVHLETSIARHKAHIMKLELILRLLDNDELSPEQVNDVKDFLDDYVERNQEDFDEFSDVDELYSTLPLDKVESLEDLVTVVPPALVKGVTVPSAVLSVKTSLASPPAQALVAVTSLAQQAASVQDQSDEVASQDSSSETVVRTPPPKSSAVATSAPTTPAGSHATQGAAAAAAALSPTSMSNAIKEDDLTSFPARKPSPALSETALRGVSRGALSNQPVASIALGSTGSVTGNGGLGAIPSASEVTKRNILVSEERLGSSSMGQPLVSPLANRMMMSQAAKATDGIGVADGANLGDATVMTGRVFSPSVGPGMQWRPGSSFQNQNEAGQFRGRTEIAPDQREKFLQKFQQVQQQGQSNLLGVPPFSGGNLKQFSSQQQNPLLPQSVTGYVVVSVSCLVEWWRLTMVLVVAVELVGMVVISCGRRWLSLAVMVEVGLFNSQSSSVTPQLGLGVGAQAVGINNIASSASLQQQPDVGHSKAEELQQQQILPEDSSADSSVNAGLGKNLLNEDDMKASYGLDTPVS